MLRSDWEKSGPQLAIDGKHHTSGSGGFYHSNKEAYPWHMRQFNSANYLKGVKIYNRVDNFGSRLKSVEVRAGKTPIDAGYKGRITSNDLCGTFVGPGEDAGVYTVTCNSPILANVVTLQIVAAGKQHLNLDEVEYILGMLDKILIYQSLSNLSLAIYAYHTNNFT